MERHRRIWVALTCALACATAIGCGASHAGDDAGSDASSPDAPSWDAGAFDASEDSGTVDAAPVIDSCEEIFDASVGASCESWLSCEYGDLFCTRLLATCPDGGVVFDDTPSTGLPDDVGCPDRGDVAVTVASPSGEATLGSGVGSFSHAFAVNVSLIFFEGEDVAACGTPRISVWLEPIDLPGYEGEHTDVVGKLALEDRYLEPTGTVTITSQEELDDRRVSLEGELDLEAEDVQVTGSFRVIECRDLDRGGP